MLISREEVTNLRVTGCRRNSQSRRMVRVHDERVTALDPSFCFAYLAKCNCSIRNLSYQLPRVNKRTRGAIDAIASGIYNSSFFVVRVYALQSL